jgi:hypothetical protein
VVQLRVLRVLGGEIPSFCLLICVHLWHSLVAASPRRVSVVKSRLSSLSPVSCLLPSAFCLLILQLKLEASQHG